MSMNEELKRQLEELKKEFQEGQPLRLPFPVVSVNYDEEVGELGSFLIGGEKRNGEWVTLPTVLPTLEFVLLKERCQYTYYNSNINKLTVKSSIVPRGQVRQAVDLISGKPISELKQSLQLTFNVLLLILVKIDSAFTPAIMRLKGATLKSWIDFTQAQKGDVAVTYLIRGTTRKEKRGNVKFYIIDFEKRDLTAEEAKAVIALSNSAVQAFEEWIFSYNNRHIQFASSLNQENQEEFKDEDVEIEL